MTAESSFHWKHHQLSSLAEARGKIYGFLSWFYLRKLDLDSIKRLLESYQIISSLISSLPETEDLGEMRRYLDELEKFLRGSRHGSSDELCQRLAVAYTQLFRGISRHHSPPPPYESLYEEGRVMGEAASAVMREYSRGGAELVIHGDEPPDNIGIELNFMSFLCFKEAGSWRDGDPAKALDRLSMELNFLRNHLLWFHKFQEAANGFKEKLVPEASFYLGIIGITKSFIELDLKLIQQIMSHG